jgi:hypothetical protein
MKRAQPSPVESHSSDEVRALFILGEGVSLSPSQDRVTYSYQFSPYPKLEITLNTSQRRLLGIYYNRNMNILFIAGFGPIVNDIQASKRLYIDTLNLPLKEEAGYYQSEAIEGVKHFALWPLSQAASSCFGDTDWPADIAVPTSWIEYEVESVESATKELLDQGYILFVENKIEPWGQVVTRFLSPEGIITSVVYSPWFHEGEK